MSTQTPATPRKSGTAPAGTGTAPNPHTGIEPSNENPTTGTPPDTIIKLETSNLEVLPPGSTNGKSSVQASHEAPTIGTPENTDLKESTLEEIVAKHKAALTAPLTEAEKTQRDAHLALIVRVGSETILAHLALKDIRDQKLFRDTHDTFEQFCLDVCDFTEARASQLIAAAMEYAALKDKVAPELLPIAEGALRKLREVDESSKLEVLQLAAELSSQNRPTGASIAEAWKQLRGNAPNDSAKDTKTKPSRLLKATRSTVELLKAADRQTFKLGELTEMQAMLTELSEAAKTLTED